MKFKLFAYASILLAIVATCGCAAVRDYFREEFASDVWSDYADAGNEADKNQQYNLAVENFRHSITELEKQGRHVDWVCSFLARIYDKQGKYHLALNVSRDILNHFENKAKNDNGDYIWELYRDLARQHCWQGEIYLNYGKFDDAQSNFEKGLKFADTHLDLYVTALLNPKDLPKGVRIDDLSDPKINQEEGRNTWRKSLAEGAPSAKISLVNPELGKYYIQVGEYEKAKRYLQEALDTAIEQRYLGKDIAIAKNNLAMAYYYAGDDQAAEKLLGGAGRINAHAFVAFNVDFAITLTMLGRIEEHRGAGDRALEAYQSAIDALRNDQRISPRSVEQADVLNQIGRFQLTQGKPEESAKAYQEAIRLRQATDTQTHPNCADAIKGLADVAAYRNELTSATLQAREALKILDTAVVPTHPRLSIELVALASIETLAGHPEQAAPLGARLETILQKPLGPWKEDFLATTAFYAGLLKKAGKTDEATRLDQLHARQKGRRPAMANANLTRSK